MLVKELAVNPVTQYEIVPEFLGTGFVIIDRSDNDRMLTKSDGYTIRRFSSRSGARKYITRLRRGNFHN